MSRFEFDALDPIVDLVDGPIDVTDPLALLAASSRNPVGLAADGVTRLVLWARGLPGPGTVTFELTDEAGGSSGVGRLRSLDGTEDVTALALPVATSSTGQHTGLAFLIAPDDFVRGPADVAAAVRPVNVSLTYAPADGGPVLAGNLMLLVRRPPVMLVHGVWSNGPNWKWTTLKYDDPDDDNIDNGGRFIVHAQDYERTNGQPFEENIGAIRAGIETARAHMRGLGFATTQVDVVAHSMGGLLSRLYVSEHLPQIPYRRPDNYLEGDVNRLITLATPHKGSPIADDTGELLSGLPTFLANLLKEKFADRGMCLDCGAVDDMRVLSPVIQAMGAADVPVHAFAATGGQPAVEEVIHVVGSASGLASVLKFLVPTIHAIYPADSEHDLLVFRDSAEGGLPHGTGVISLLQPDDPPGKSATHTQIINNNNYAPRVIDLLNTPVGDATKFAPGFPANGGGGGLAGDLDLPPYGPLVTGLEITEPLPGALVTPGQALTVAVSGFDGFVPARVLILSVFDSEFIDEAPYAFDLSIPAEAIGPLAISALAFDADWNLAAAEDVVVQVAPAAALAGIRFDPGALVVVGSAPEQQLHVVGSFDDGVERDVSSAALGSAYASSNPAVALVNAGGLLTAVSVGTATVVATNGKHEASTQVEVLSLPCAGDLDGDGGVGIVDLLGLLAEWGPCPASRCAGDLDGDSIVGGSDLGALLASWGLCP